MQYNDDTYLLFKVKVVAEPNGVTEKIRTFNLYIAIEPDRGEDGIREVRQAALDYTVDSLYEASHFTIIVQSITLVGKDPLILIEER